MTFSLLNGAPGENPPPFPLPSKFTLAARPDTDIWRKPPSTFSFNAPILYHTLRLADFKRARVTVRGPWKALYDQGGLCFYMPLANNEGDRSWKWVKSGIEFYQGRPHIGTVACEKWADWSLVELDGNEVTVEIEREVDEQGKKTSSLWVYAVGKDGKRQPLREITWVFESLLEDGQSEQPLCIGVYAARPKKDEDNHEAKLEVTFQDLKIETWDGPIKI